MWRWVRALHKKRRREGGDGGGQAGTAAHRNARNWTYKKCCWQDNSIAYCEKKLWIFMSEHLLLSVAMSSPSALHSPCALIHLPPLPIEAWETSVVAAAAAAAIFWQLLMDAGNTNERFNDSQAVLVSAMIAYIFSIYQRKFAPFAHSKKLKTLADKKCKVWYDLFFKYFFVQHI